MSLLPNSEPYFKKAAVSSRQSTLPDTYTHREAGYPAIQPVFHRDESGPKTDRGEKVYQSTDPEKRAQNRLK